jgi:predicted nucleotidyltransferase
VELPADVAQLLERLRDELTARGGLTGIYLYGSLTTGDFSPARSDIDLVVMVTAELDRAAIGELRQLHVALAASDDPAGRLHCLYVPAQTASDPDRLCPYWYGDRMARRRRYWLRDSWVDLGLTALARSAAVLSIGELITKTEAISRLAEFGVPAELAAEIRRRRDGEAVALGAGQRVRRARMARQIMKRGVTRLLEGGTA